MRIINASNGSTTTVSDMKSLWKRTVRMDTNDLCVYLHEQTNIFSLMNQQELHNTMKEWKKLCKIGRIYVLNENNKTKKIDGEEFHILIIQGSGIEISKAGLLFDGEFLGVEGWIYMFRSKFTRDTVYNYISKYCQVVMNSDKHGECSICMDDCSLFATKCCNQTICRDCVAQKKSNVCPFCRHEFK